MVHSCMLPAARLAPETAPRYPFVAHIALQPVATSVIFDNFSVFVRLET